MSFENLPGGILPWAIGGGVVVFLLLVLIVVAVSRGSKKKVTKSSPLMKAAPTPVATPAAAKPAAPQPAPAPSVPGAIAVGDVGSWMQLGSPQPVEVSNGGLRVSGGIRSKATVPPTAGTTYRLEIVVRAAKDPTNGSPLNFCAGPIAIDKVGAMVAWWAAQEPITVAEGRRKVTVEMKVPAGAETVCVGLNGPYSVENKPIANGVIELESASLVAI